MIPWRQVKAGDTFLHAQTGELATVVDSRQIDSKVIMLSFHGPNGKLREMQVHPDKLVTVRE